MADAAKPQGWELMGLRCTSTGPRRPPLDLTGGSLRRVVLPINASVSSRIPRRTLCNN